MTTNFCFRWWYFLLLVPVVLYLTAHWYAGYRIDRAIRSANEQGNSLTVGRYDYGFFPTTFTADAIHFHQQRKAFTATGSLRQLKVSGLQLFSLFGNNPIRLNRIALEGLDANLVRTAPPTSSQDSSTFALTVDEFALDSTYLTLKDVASGRQLSLHHLGLSVEPLTFPFRPADIARIRTEADSVAYRSLQDSLQAVATTIQYATEYGAITVRNVSFRQGRHTDLYATDLRFTGLDHLDLTEGVTLDSISAAQVGGGAQVQTTSEGQSSAPATPPAPATLLRLKTLFLPNVDVSLSGAFGAASLDGALLVSGVQYRDSLQLDSLRLDGRELSLANNKALVVRASGATVRQGTLQYPLQPAAVGPTRITIPELTVEAGQQTISVAELDYSSASRDLSGTDLRISGQRINGTVAAVQLSEVDRDALLAGRPISARRASVQRAELTITNRDGGSYRLSAPELILTGISAEGGFRTERALLTNGSLRRRSRGGHEDIVARGVYLDQYGIRSPFDAARLGPSKLRVDHVTIYGEEEPTDYTFDGIRYTSRLGVLTLDSLNRRNRLTAAKTFRDKVSKSWLNFGFAGLRASGIAHDPLLRGETVAVDSLTAQDFRLLVVEDLSAEFPPKDKRMPIEALRRLGPRILLGAARLSSANIAYGVVDTVLEPKTIHFSAGTVRLDNLDTELSTTDSVRLSLDATFEGNTPVHAEFALARDSSGRNYAIRGEFGRYDLSGINPLFEIAANAYIESGIIEEMTYRGALQSEVLTGELTMLYHDLDVTLVGSGSWFKNLLSGVVLKKENTRGEDFRQGKMYHEHSRDRSFFNAYWKGLVSGMRSSALADIALQKELD